MRVSLVIATHNRGPAIERLLRSLPAQTLATTDWEAIVVNDGSTDDTLARLARFQGEGLVNFRFIDQKNAGAAAARDRGIRAALGQRIVVTDDDMELAPDYLAAHLAAAAADPERTVVLGAIRPTDNWREKPLFDVVGEYRLAVRHERFAQGGVTPEPWELVTGNVSYPRDLYVGVGGFDLSLRLWEDLELGFRLGRAGAKVVFSADAWTIHHSDIGDYEKWKRRQVNHGLAAVQVWEANGRAASLHPLANLVNGSRLKRLLVLLLCRWSWTGEAGVALLARVGDLLQKAGLLRGGIAAYQLIESLAFHLGLKQRFGSWQRVLELADDYRAAR